MNKQEAIEKIKEKSWVKEDRFSRDDDPAIYVEDVIDIINQIDDRPKVKIPQFVAEWIEKCQSKIKNLKYAITEAPEDVSDWMSCNQKGNMDKFALAWVNGYEVEQEKRYRVKIENNGSQPLTLKKLGPKIFFVDEECDECFTKQEIEQAGFAWLFDCDGAEVEEVEGWKQG